MAAEGGAPKRLTWHPDADVVVGWTPDGKKIVYKSGGESYADFTKLYLVAAEGGVPEALPMWRDGGGFCSPGAPPMAPLPHTKRPGAPQEARRRVEARPLFLLRSPSCRGRNTRE